MSRRRRWRRGDVVVPTVLGLLMVLAGAGAAVAGQSSDGSADGSEGTTVLPGATIASVTLPSATLPPLSLPPAPIPGVTSVTVPPVSLPPVSLPPVSLPPVTVPSLSPPPVQPAPVAAVSPASPPPAVVTTPPAPRRPTSAGAGTIEPAPAAGAAVPAAAGRPSPAPRPAVERLPIRLRRAAVDTAQQLSFPMGLALAVGVFLILQHRVDRSDPRLAAGTRLHDDDLLGFS